MRRNVLRNTSTTLAFRRKYQSSLSTNLLTYAKKLTQEKKALETKLTESYDEAISTRIAGLEKISSAYDAYNQTQKVVVLHAMSKTRLFRN